MNHVPCNGCVRCCIADAVRLLPGDQAELYRTVEHPTVPGQRMLDHKPGGACWYLGEAGCTIQSDKPLMCQEFDCRLVNARLNYTGARKMKILELWKKGGELRKKEKQGSN